MNAHGADGAVETVAASCVLGLLSWIMEPEVLRALAVAAACGLVGGMFRPMGSRIGDWFHKKYDERKGKRK